MNTTSNDFISNDKKKFEWRIGKLLASSLSGFIAGIIVATIFFVVVFDLLSKVKDFGM